MNDYDPHDQIPAWLKPFSRLQLHISERRLLMMFGDVVAILIAVTLALRIWALTAGEPFSLEFVIVRSPWYVILPLTWYVLASANDYFSFRVTALVSTNMGRLLFISAQLLALYFFIFFFVHETLPRLFILNYTLFSFFLIAAWRLWQPFLLGWPGFRRRALIIGGGHSAEMIVGVIRHEAANYYDLVGFVESAEHLPHSIEGLQRLGTGEMLATFVSRFGITELIVAYSTQIPADIFQGIMACYEQNITILPMPLVYEKITGRIPVEEIGDHFWSVLLLNTERTSLSRLYFLFKRLIDLLLALAGLVVLIILLPLLAMLIRLDSPGPIFYSQERLGRSGKPFKLYKLRSMLADAENGSGPRWSEKGDVRVTGVGRWLRRTRLDELPQLYNVFNGEMSLIGPRPERPEFVEQLTEAIPFYRSRLAVKPGITGWAQVRSTYGSSVEDALTKLQYDLYYIRHQSIGLDIDILVRTVKTMVTFQGT